MRLVIILITVMFLQGCVAFRENIIQPIELPDSKINKSISLNIYSECYTRGGKRTNCTTYKESLLWNLEKQIGINKKYADYDIDIEKEDLIRSMNDTGIFGFIDYNNEFLDYNVDIKFVHDENYSLFMSIVTFIPSLGFIPTYETDDYYITIEVMNNKTKKYMKSMIRDQLITVNGTIFAPFMGIGTPLKESIKLNNAIYNNISYIIYNSIMALENSNYLKKE